MTTSDPSATAAGVPDLLGSPEPVRPGRWQTALVAVIGTAAVAIATTGVAVAAAFAGGGAQPEDVLPADVVALVKVDLDPAGGQKTAAIELAERFPDLGVDGEGDLRDDLLRQLLKGQEVVDYDRQVRPWIGDRLALAALPGDAMVEPVLVVQHDDRDAAERLLPELLEGGEDPGFFAFSENASYVVVASTQEVADAVASAQDVLADDEQYADDVDSLDGDQVALAWGDAGRFWAGLPAEERDLAAASFPGELSPSGRGIIGLHLEDDAVELTGRYVGVDFGDDALNTYALGSGEGTGLVTELPAGAVGAMSLAGLGEQVEALLELVTNGLGASGGEQPLTEGDLTEFEQLIGISLPEDAQALLGDEAAVGVYDEDGEPQVAVRTRGGDPDRGLQVAQQLLDFGTTAGGPAAQDECFAEYDLYIAEEGLDPADFPREEACPELDVEQAPPNPLSTGAVGGVEDGVAFGSTESLLARVADGGLGDDELFRRAVPDVDGASSVGFVDLQRAFQLAGESDEKLSALEAIGFAGTGGGDGGFTVRLTVR